jgi:hypothetical protein
MKRLAIWVGAVLLSSCCVYTQVKHPPERLTPAEQAMDKTVALVHFIDKEDDEVSPESDEPSKMVSYCAGVWVSKDVVVTAGHCVEDLGRPPPPPDFVMQMMIAVLTGQPPPELPDWDPTGQPVYYSAYGDVKNEHGGKKFRSYHDARVLSFDKKHDLALVKADGSNADLPIPQHLVAGLAREVHVGEDLQIVGHPIGQWWTYIKGTVSAIRIATEGTDNRILDAVQVSAPVFFGNSGGGAFNSDGDLVGICSWLKRAPNMSFFVHRDHVEDLLKHNGIR